MDWLPILWVEGLIAAGKTTLVKTLAETLHFRALYEPVADEQLLDLFYQDPKRWAFPFQIEMLRRRSTLHDLATLETQVVGSPWKGVIIDRGLPGDRVFAQLHHEQGNIHDAEWAIYEELYKKFMFVPHIQPSLLIYLDVSPETAMQRIKTRGRKAEKSVRLEYLEAVSKCYTEMLQQIQKTRHPWSRGMKVLTIPWNEDHESVGAIATTVREILYPANSQKNSV